MEIPTYIVLHGILLTLWFVLLLAQSLLVATRRIGLHRTLGAFGALVAAALVLISAIVVIRAVPRVVAAGLPTSGMALEVVGDLAVLPLFLALVTLAVLFRHKPQIHKRLMAVASICIVAPAIVRWPGAAAAAPLSIIGPQLLLFAALMVYDFVSLRKIQRATLLSVAAYVGLLAVVVPVASSELGQSIVNSLK